MKITEIKSLKREELEAKIKSEKEILDKLKFANAVAPIENPSKIRQTKTLIARLLTELTSRA